MRNRCQAYIFSNVGERVALGLFLLSLFISNLITGIEIAQSSTEDNEAYLINIRTLTSTTYPIEDLEIIESKSPNTYLDIYICESEMGDTRRGQISHVFGDTMWTYDALLIEDKVFQQLETIRFQDTLVSTQLIVGHEQGVTLLSEDHEGEWTTDPLSEFDYHHAWELITGNIDTSTTDEEALLIYEGMLLDFAYFQMFSYNGSWKSQIIYMENPVTRAVYLGEFNSSHLGTELICANEGGYVTLLQGQKDEWHGTQLWDFGNALCDSVVATDFYSSSLAEEFVVGCVNSSMQFVALFSYKTGNWSPEIIPLEGNTEINEIIITDITDSPVPDIIVVDEAGNVWLVVMEEESWEVTKLWQDIDSIRAVKALNHSNTIIVGGKSKKLTEITINQPISTTDQYTTTVSKSTFFAQEFVLLSISSFYLIKKKHR
ncbi:MAG: hypothetical protein ACFFCQ_08750 [Promethearchaeota archaeon]